VTPEYATRGSRDGEFESSGPPVVVVNETGRAPFVLLCEHASRLLPKGYASLGLPAAEFDRHIAWDIGAAEMATRVACLLDAPLFLAGYSRLLIDLNRPPGSRSSIPEVSEATLIPGNVGLDPSEARHRRDLWFEPFQEAVAAHLDARLGQPTAVVGIHTFTPVFNGVARPWHAGVLFGEADEFGLELASAIEATCGCVVGRNEPYRIDIDNDYTVPVHGDARGLAAALIEVRQDLVTHVFAIDRWSRILAGALAAVAHLVGTEETYRRASMRGEAMPRQTNPDNADTPQEVGDRISADLKRGPKAPRKSRKPDPAKLTETRKKPGT
jgi:predicted N-formylglutamate amidohydrolase